MAVFMWLVVSFITTIGLVFGIGDTKEYEDSVLKYGLCPSASGFKAGFGWLIFWAAISLGALMFKLGGIQYYKSLIFCVLRRPGVNPKQ